MTPATPEPTVKQEDGETNVSSFGASPSIIIAGAAAGAATAGAAAAGAAAAGGATAGAAAAGGAAAGGAAAGGAAAGGAAAGGAAAPSSFQQLWVGTSGYSYREWVEAGFYPQGTRTGQMLGEYARRFPATELNYTWYQMPRAEAVERQRRQAPPGFLFAAKLTRSLTHEVEDDAWRQEALAYREGVAPLLQAGQLLAVLIQLPPGFTRTVPKRRYLDQLLDALEGLPLAIEFRHASWLHDRVFAELERRRITLVTVDEPELPNLLPPLDVVTNPDLLYFRFHGRNAKGWRSGKMQMQFDYDYSEDELRQWIGRIVPMSERASRGAVFFNNHVQAQAPRNAEVLSRLLLQAGLPVVPALRPPLFEDEQP